MTGTDTGVSVVIATYNRCHLLPWLFDGLARQTVDVSEVVVVDDGSTDATPVVLRGLARRARFPVRAIRLERNVGPGAARNAGWQVARSEVVAFVDDDCRPTPTWLAAIADAAVTSEIVQGATLPDPAGAARRGPWSHTVEIPSATGTFETCNIAYRRTLLEKLGGFDESYRTGEDVDLGCRAVEAGARFMFSAEAVVHHDVSRSDWFAYLRRLRRYDGAVRAIREHPETRRNLFRGVLYSEAHPPAVLAALGLAVVVAARGSGRLAAVGAVLLAPYLHHRVFVSQVPAARKWTWPWTIPLALGADVVETAALARASLRWRTLVL